MKTLDSSSASGGLLDELREWGFFGAPASGSKYPVLKSLQSALIVTSFGLLPALPLFFTTQPFCAGRAETGVNFLIAVSLNVAFMMYFVYWVSSTMLFCRLGKSGHLAKLSADAREIFQSKYDREFEVAADLHTCMERLVGALQADKNARVDSLDTAEGIAEIAFIRGLFRMRDLKVKVVPVSENLCQVHMVSSLVSRWDRYMGAIDLWLLDFCDLEDRIKTGKDCTARNPRFFNRPKFCFPGFMFTRTVLLTSLTTLLAISINSSGPRFDDLVKESHAAQLQGDSSLAAKHANAAVQNALTAPEDESTLALAYANKAYLAILQAAGPTIAQDNGSSLSDSAREELKLAESDLKKSMALDPKWGVPFCQMACVEALRGNTAEAEKLMAQGKELIVASDAEPSRYVMFEESLLRSAKGLFYRIQHDDIAAVSCYETSNGSESLDMLDAKFALGLWSKMAAKNPHLHDAFTNHREEYQQFEDSYSYYNEPSAGIFYALATYLLIFALSPALLACLLKDGYRLAALDTFEDFSAKELTENSRSFVASEIEKELDEEQFWNNYMRSLDETPRKEEGLITETANEVGGNETTEEQSGCMLDIRRTALS